LKNSEVYNTQILPLKISVIISGAPYMKNFLSVLCFMILFAETAPALNNETGTVENINLSKKEITIKLLSGKSVKMGERLEIITSDGLITLIVKFPMMTIATCGIQGKGNISSIKPEMPVYPYGNTPQNIESANNGTGLSDTGQGMIRDNSTGIFCCRMPTTQEKPCHGRMLCHS
jgi:hypothetical protein